MHFFGISVALLAAGAAALPPSAGGVGNGNGIGNKGNTAVKFPVPDDMTVKQAQAKCGDQAQLSCCNHATWAGDTTDVNSGILAGTLGNLIGAGSGSTGLGLFDQCSQLDVQGELHYSRIIIIIIIIIITTELTWIVPAVLGVLAVQDLLKKKCQQNIACCQNSPSNAVSIMVMLSASICLC